MRKKLLRWLYRRIPIRMKVKHYVCGLVPYFSIEDAIEAFEQEMAIADGKIVYFRKAPEILIQELSDGRMTVRILARFSVFDELDLITDYHGPYMEDFWLRPERKTDRSRKNDGTTDAQARDKEKGDEKKAP